MTVEKLIDDEDMPDPPLGYEWQDVSAAESIEPSDIDRSVIVWNEGAVLQVYVATVYGDTVRLYTDPIDKQDTMCRGLWKVYGACSKHCFITHVARPVREGG